MNGTVRLSRPGRMVTGALLAAALGAPALAQESLPVTGYIEWGIWVDPDGCTHWVADGGFEGYMVPRINPATGRPICGARPSTTSQSQAGS
ncbi:hypothetical protein SAMN04515673_104243 [Poseidonocella sedimentorum]|uniref:Uncharacterized protein n=2 Tax=Poseidonocella sedimentorum TaxID=871652 RepID=A0A1I6DQ23_9RHOB|nr:hypothetical protein SAMN04515673_104243 [Poseidonocella sedimentorum]